MYRKLAVAMGLVVASLLATSTAEAVPTTMSFSARISDGSGPIDGAVDLNIKIFDASSGGMMLWEESHGGAMASSGLVHLELGSTDPVGNGLDTSVFDGGNRWLELSIGGIVQTPRLKIGSVPYAVKAADADTVGGRSASSLQEQVTGSCAAGSSIRRINADGTVTCEPDDNTTYSAGTGLTLSGTQLNADTNYLQRRVSSSCSSGTAMRAISTTGSPTCSSVLNGTSQLYPATNVLVAFGGADTSVAAAASYRICMLSHMRVSNGGTCRVVPSGGIWTLYADSGTASDYVECRMLCVQ